MQAQVAHSGRFALRLVAAAALIAVTLGAAPGGAAAAPGGAAADPAGGARPSPAPSAIPLGEIPAGAIQVPLTVDCAGMTDPKVKAYAVEHRYCPAAGSGAETDGVEIGNCGLTFFFVGDFPGADLGSFYYGFNSILGPVVFRALFISWSNVSIGGGGGFPDSGFMFSPSYAAIAPVFTGAGFVRGTMTGSVTLVWGGGCIVTPNSDVNIVT